MVWWIYKVKDGVSMRNNKVEELFERLAVECSSYKEGVLKKSNNEIFKASSKNFFVSELESFVSAEGNMEYFEENDTVLGNLDSITLDGLFKYYAKSEDNHFDTCVSLVVLINEYCVKDEWHLEQGKSFVRSIWQG